MNARGPHSRRYGCRVRFCKIPEPQA